MRRRRHGAEEPPPAARPVEPRAGIGLALSMFAARTGARPGRRGVPWTALALGALLGAIPWAVGAWTIGAALIAWVRDLTARGGW